jgi:hypothetical protein
VAIRHFRMATGKKASYKRIAIYRFYFLNEFKCTKGTRFLPIMKLRSDPYLVFRHSKTPAGLYARTKWLNQSQQPGYKRDFDETVVNLLKGQSADGSWEQSAITTIKRLFDLHLTVRDENESARKALDWLTAQTLPMFSRPGMHLAETISPGALNGLPFADGGGAILISAATLFLASVFGRSTNPAIMKIYEWFETRGVDGTGRWCGWKSYVNILRAFVVHPDYSKRASVQLAVQNFKGIQKESGRWAANIPFHQTVNALAHLAGPGVERQLSRAFDVLLHTQQRDGTWSRFQPEWNSFLVIHALKNRGEL